MNRDTVSWRGYIPAITTPFTKAGNLDSAAYKTLLEWLLGEGMHGLIIGGTQGEWFSWSNADRLDIYRITRDVIGRKIPTIAGCMGYNANEAIQHAALATEYGFDGILLCPPPYVVPNEVEIFNFYQDVNDSIELPLCVYNWPPGTNVNMSLDLLSKLSQLDKVVAVKNSTPDFGHFISTFYALKSEVRVFGIPMNDLGVSLIQNDKGDGLMGAGAVLGRGQPDFFNAIWDGEIERAKALGKRDVYLMQQWFNSDYTSKFGTSQAIFKEALNIQGLPGGYPKRPILPLNETDKARVHQTLNEVGRI